MNKKLFSLLGFAAKSGKISYGFEATVTALKTGKSRLVLVADDISVKSRKEIVFYSDKAKVKHITLDGINIKAVSDAVGRKCGIISINDSGFADACTASIQGGFANDE